MNPWLSMWSQPRDTVRAVIQQRPNYRVYNLAALFALEAAFSYANWWSFGLELSNALIILTSVVLSPVIGFVWLFVAGWVYTFTGRWLGGQAPAAHVRIALAWTKLPALAGLLMWVVFIILNPSFAFIQDGNLWVILISSLTGVWTLILLIPSIRAVQHFSLSRAICNIMIASFIATFLFFLAAFFFCLLKKFLDFF